jgi:hypothetical protein
MKNKLFDFLTNLGFSNKKQGSNIFFFKEDVAIVFNDDIKIDIKHLKNTAKILSKNNIMSEKVFNAKFNIC